MPGSTVAPDASLLRRVLGLDALAAVTLGATVLVLELRGDRRGPDDGFLADPVPAVLALAAFALAIAAGVVAAWALVRAPPRTRPGRWGARLAGALAGSFPVVWVSALALDRGEDGVAAFVPLQLAAGVAAVILGAVAPEPGRRGLLVVPVVIGTAALAFILGDLIVPGT